MTDSTQSMRPSDEGNCYVTLCNIAKSSDLRSIRQSLRHVHAELHDATCWERVLHAELHAARFDISQLSKHQTSLLIREAEILGRIKKIPESSPRHFKKKPATEPVSPEAIKAVLASMSDESKEALLTDLLGLERTKHNIRP